MLVIVCSWLDVLLLSGTGALVVVVNVDVDRGLLPRYDHIIRLSEYRNIGFMILLTTLTNNNNNNNHACLCLCVCVCVCVSGLAC